MAVIGYGTAGAILHGPLIAATAGLDLAAIVTSDPARRAAAASAHPGATILGDAGAVLAGGFDLVVIATPPATHAALAELAIRAGLPVVVEKPLAVSSADARRVIGLATAAHVPLAVFQNRRWDADFLTVRALLATGRLGRPYRLESCFEPYRPMDPAAPPDPSVADGGGVLLDIGSHRIDQAMLLFGAPRTVHAELHRRRPGAAAEDDAFVTLAFDRDVTCHLRMGLAARAGGPAFRLVGADATFEVDGADPQWAALARGGRPGGAAWGRPSVTGRLTSGDAEAETVTRVRLRRGAYQRFYEGVRDALRARGAMPVDPGDAVDVLRVIEAARRSATSGRTVRVTGLRDRAPGPRPGSGR